MWGFLKKMLPGAASGNEEADGLPVDYIPDSPGDFSLGRNFPEPASVQTVIPFRLSTDSTVHVTLYDSAGQKLKEYNIGPLSAGEQTTLLNVKDQPSGAYTYQLTAENMLGVFVHTHPLQVK